jgi:hypothetical protein
MCDDNWRSIGELAGTVMQRAELMMRDRQSGTANGEKPFDALPPTATWGLEGEATCGSEWKRTPAETGAKSDREGVIQQNENVLCEPRSAHAASRCLPTVRSEPRPLGRAVGRHLSVIESEIHVRSNDLALRSGAN